MQTIDAHQHFWKYDPIKHSWIDDTMSVIKKNFLPGDGLAVMQQNDILGIVAVQADQSIEETNFLLDLADKYPIIKGVVGWIDLRADDLEGQLEKYAGQKTLKGFRHVVQDEADPQFMLYPAFTAGIKSLEKLNYTYDILIFHHQLPAAIELVRQFPNQKFVLDHIAKPDIKSQAIDAWKKDIETIAQFPNLMCKVSGMITEADLQNWTYDQLVPYLDTIFDAFGTERILFGSDYPVCLLAVEYSQVKNIIQRYIDAFSETEKKQIMQQNAMTFYSL